MQEVGQKTKRSHHDKMSCKASRLAQVYGYSPNGGLLPQERFGGSNNHLMDQQFKSGGGGLVSSTMDYMRFAQMVLNGGELDGVRILAPLTRALCIAINCLREWKELAWGQVVLHLDWILRLLKIR